MGCDHKNFKARVNVARIARGEGGPVVAYSADVVIVCGDCQTPFEFVGLPHGCSAYRPTVSMDCQEARMPIVPIGTVPPPDMPGFAVNVEVTEH